VAAGTPAIFRPGAAAAPRIAKRSHIATQLGMYGTPWV